MPNNIEEAFNRGFLKRAEYYGFDKRAFVAPVVGGLVRHLAAPVLSAELSAKGLGLLAKRKNALGRGAGKLQNFLKRSPGAQTAFTIGSDMALSPVIGMATNPIADMIDPQTTQQQQG